MTQDLITIDPESMGLQPHDLFQSGGTEDLISRIEEEARSVLPDVSTPKGRKAVASNASKVDRSKTYLDGLGKDLVSRLKQQSKLIDEERRRMRTRLSELKTEVRQPLTDIENREKARVLSLQGRVAGSFAIRDTSSLEAIDAQIANITAVPIDDTWAEYNYTARMAQRSTLKELATLRNEELKRLYAEEKRKAEKEASRVKAEAQQKVRDAQQKARVAEQEWLAKAAKERAKEEAAKKNREVQARVHSEMSKAISEAADVDCGVARKVVKAIAKGQVQHVTISYS